MQTQTAPCPNGCGTILVGQFLPIRVPMTEADGSPLLEADGKPVTALLRLQAHAIPGIATPSRFDPTGIAPSGCIHGLAEHPDPVADAYGRRRGGRSFLRSKYMTDPHPGRDCPVCRDEPRPEDLCVAADGSPVGELLFDRLAREALTAE